MQDMELMNDDSDFDDGSDLPVSPPVVPDSPCAMYPWMDEDVFNPEDFLINYNEKFKNERSVLFRDDVVRQTLSCLIGRLKPNALLVGAAGTGKTRIVEDIARRIAVNDGLIPDQLKEYTIWELPLSNIRGSVPRN